MAGRISLDILRAHSTRRENYVGSWLPEPVVSTDPGERLAFVLHDMIAVPFDEIAILERNPLLCVNSRARPDVACAVPH